MSHPDPTTTAARPRKARHLIDLDAPRPVRNVRQEKASLTRVQQWVMSTVVVTFALHMSAGLILAAMALEERGTTAQVGLNVIAGAFGVLGVAAALAIHRRRPLSAWLLVGTLPCFVGLWLTF
jgi:hypothetical protein